MDSTLPDAFEASQLESSGGQGLGAGAIGIESMGSRNSFARGPYVKVDGMLVLHLLRYGHFGRWPLTFSFTDPPKFELESYIANYTGMWELR